MPAPDAIDHPAAALHDPAAAHGMVVRMLTGHWTVQAVYVFAKLGVADQMNDGPVPAARLARALSVDEQSLFRVLRALVTAGLLHARPERSFELTAMGARLRSDAHHSLRDLAIMSGEEQYTGWGRLLDGVRRGRPAFEQAHGTSLFEYLRQHPAAASTFDGAMVGLSGSLGESLAARLDFSKYRDIIDLGGGRGVFMSEILARTPNVCGIVFDLPHVAARAGAFMAERGFTGRGIAIGGDFFESIPEGGDLYIFCQTLFNWSDAQVERLLRRCKAQLGDRGSLLIVEPMLGEDSRPFAAMMDLQMMAMPGGRVRTVDEYDAALRATGLALVEQFTLTPLGATVLLARPG